jgi:two-component system, cell cycle sensor histidine kinase and response regulator CckA
VPTDPKGPDVLVVEDEWLLREELTAALRKEGFTVVEARNGESAVNILSQPAGFDILITDIFGWVGG